MNKEAIIETIQILQKEIEEKEITIKSLNKLLGESYFEPVNIKEKPKQPLDPPFGNSSDTYGDSFAAKFLNVLKIHQRFMKVREIAEAIVKLEGGDVSKMSTQLSRRTFNLKKINKIVKFHAGKSNKDVVWGSPKWMDDGAIVPKYIYNEDAIGEVKVSKLNDIEL